MNSLVTPAVAVDRAFPTLHPRPRQGWLNDPNGICYRDGRWHVFFQHNPDSARHAAIAWGHVSSPDLLRWEEEPVALRPQSGGPDALGCWSGVMADDDGIPTAVYSGVQDASGHAQVTLARGSADLRSWRQDGEVAAGIPGDPSVTDVRDPFLFTWHGTRYAIQGAGLEDGRGALLLYDATDLSAWTYLGIWLTTEHPAAASGAQANIWECPQLVEVDGRWILIVSLWKRRDGAHHLSGVAHLIGSMHDDDGGRPVFEPETCAATDGGPDFYAPQAVQGGDRVMLWGWSWESRAEEEADAVGWAGVLTFPRELRVIDGELVVKPARELVGYRRRARVAGAVTELPAVAEAVVSPRGGVRVSLTLVSPSGSREVYSAETEHGVRVLLDASIVEVYREGSTPVTFRAYPSRDEKWELTVTGNAVVEAWELGLP
ncbi:glycoside hydrolase family 32 protein [uncultured Arthrobacter sp.]|uniref:glycoside hydrolase family 32 protein n=1 Tax=uncultured Arthrobacter sp. TaxID=114050 RepID=UPI00260A17D8|nr:glycoside hydrolase family 32 protein [uncultured Arthrobacter sp.]